jgi:hypothetical protein
VKYVDALVVIGAVLLAVAGVAAIAFDIHVPPVTFAAACWGYAGLVLHVVWMRHRDI